jgi:hypothetical protein
VAYAKAARRPEAARKAAFFMRGGRMAGMDDNKPRRRWLSFGIRDLLWAMVVLGMGVGWWLEHRSVQRAKDNLCTYFNLPDGDFDGVFHGSTFTSEEIERRRSETAVLRRLRQ